MMKHGLALSGSLAGSAGFLMLLGLIILVVLWRRGILSLPAGNREDAALTPNKRMGVLQRYILGEAIAPILLTLLALTFFLLVQKIYLIIEMLLESRSPGLVGELALSLLPSVFSLTVPIAILIGVLLGVGRMAAENEIRACQTAGVNLVRIFWPLIALCVLVSVAMITLNHEYTPRMRKRYAQLENRLKFTAQRMFQPGVEARFESGSNRIDLTYMSRDPKTEDMVGIRMLVKRKTREEVEVEVASGSESDKSDTKGSTRIRPPRSGDAFAQDPAPPPEPQTRTEMQTVRHYDLIFAERGRLSLDQKMDQLSIQLVNASVHMIDPLEAPDDPDALFPEPGRGTVANFDTLSYPLEREMRDTRPEEVSFTEMLAGMPKGKDWKVWSDRSAKGRQEFTRELRAEMATRTAVPLACVAFALLGIPLAVLLRPSGKLIGIALACVLILLYYWLVQWGSGMTKDGHAMGMLVIFLPNLLMAGLGLFLFRRAVRL